MTGLHGKESAGNRSSPQSGIPFSSQPRSRIKLLVVIAAVVIVVVVMMVLGAGGSGSESLVVEDNKVHTIQMNVLNGVGRSNLAQQMTDYLRSRGFDVVEIGNYAEELERTLVIDRTGNSRAAEQVAEALGVPTEQVMQKIDKNLFLDVSVFIGKDYQSLRPYH